jgi:O-antigen/teichoic acid export membrane protein
MQSEPVNLSLKNKLSFLAKDSLLYGLATAINRAVALITFPLLARYFSVTEYGLIDLFTVFSGFLTILFIFGQDSAVARYFYEYKDNENRKHLISESLFMQLILLAAFIPLIWIAAVSLAPFLSDSDNAVLLLKLNLLQVPFLLLMNFSRNILKWTFARKEFLIISLGYVILYLILLLPAIFVFNIDVEGVFIVALMAQITISFLSLFYVRKWLVVPRKIKFTKELLYYAIPYGITCCIGAFVPTLERAIVSNFIGSYELGLYSAGAKIAMFVSIIAQAFQTAWGPFYLSIHKEHDAISTYNWVLKFFAIFMFSSVMLLSASSGFILNILASQRYLDAVIVIFPLAMAWGVQSVSWITEIGIALSKKSYLNLYAYSSFIIIGGLSIYFLGSRFGIVGIAYGVLAGHCARALVASSLSRRVYQMEWILSPVMYIFILTISVGFFGSSMIYYSFSGSTFIYLGASFLIPLVALKILFTSEERSLLARRLKAFSEFILR